MKLRIFVAATLMAASAAALAATESSDVAVTIENQAITLNNVAGLNFGTILPFGRDGVVTVNTAGQASASNAFVSDVTDVAASAWEVTGVPGAPFNVVLPPNETVTVTNGTENMIVTSFRRSGSSSGLALDAAGFRAFTVGASLRVGANQPAGEYTGQFEVTVAYN